MELLYWHIFHKRAQSFERRSVIDPIRYKGKMAFCWFQYWHSESDTLIILFGKQHSKTDEVRYRNLIRIAKESIERHSVRRMVDAYKEIIFQLYHEKKRIEAERWDNIAAVIRDHFKPGAGHFSWVKISHRMTCCRDFAIPCTTNMPRFEMVSYLPSLLQKPNCL